MISQGRINDFKGTVSEYITYLESLVLQKTSAHPPSTHPPPSPPSDARNEAIESSDSDEASASSIEFIPYQPPPSGRENFAIWPPPSNQDHFATGFPPAKRRQQRPRWEREMDKMLTDTWFSDSESVGLSSATQILTALDTIMGIKQHAKPLSSEADLSIVHSNSPDGIIQLLSTYSNATAMLETQQKSTTQTYFFRVLVFVSLCCVALYHKVDKSVVDKIMQKSVSNAGTKHLRYLRNGALWVNRMICELGSEGHVHLASELFMRCKFELHERQYHA
jgi:hypothetical protein